MLDGGVQWFDETDATEKYFSISVLGFSLGRCFVHLDVAGCRGLQAAMGAQLDGWTA